MRIDFIKPVIKYLPEVSIPKKVVPFREKLIWTAVVLALFFIMGVIYPVGVGPSDLPSHFQQFQIIFASSMGSIVSTGIGPIVTASIVLQLLVGAKMLDLDLTKTEDKALFQAAQKILTVLIAFFEAGAVVYGFHLGAELIDGVYVISPYMAGFTIFQIAMGSILLMYMDEVVSKWGVGSGIGLFIAGGVSQTIISASFNPLTSPAGSPYGIIPNFIYLAMAGTINMHTLLLLFPIFATILVFLAVVYCESMRLEIPLSYGGIRGVGGRYPLKFFYVSNIPVILAAALLMNVQMWTNFAGVDLAASPAAVAEMGMIQKIIYNIGSNITMGNLHGILDPANWNNLFELTTWVHLLIYSLVFIGLCILFGKFWVETTGLGAKQVADQIQGGGMQIPGFRRDKRIVERVLNRYIPQITIISSVAVGLLAVGADLCGAIGSGTGILLTVGILYRLYEEIQKEQMADMHPAFRRFMGKG